MTLAELFPDSDYRFSMWFERGRPEDYFAPTLANPEILAERCGWLSSAPETYAVLLPEGVPLLEETVQLMRSWGSFACPDVTAGAKASWAACLALGASLEPDVVLLKPDNEGVFRLAAGVVCFPSHWSLTEKAGRPLEMIHDPVPGLNAALGNQIKGFLDKLRPGVAWLRSNWGLTLGAERNDHPTRSLPRLDASVRLEDVWVRLEHQALVALPQTGGVLFGIRLALHRMAEVKADPALARGLVRALQTMPEQMARYKGLATARGAIIRLLQCSDNPRERKN